MSVFHPNATRAEGALILIEQALIGCVMQEDGMVIGENEFDPTEGIPRPGVLP